ncbi:tRNA uridine-5-carboxymethylaminomethyl(34) synthesis GTPase MnmE [Mesoplasma lactucae]|uniref:tRNA modification GTPase MnmE n=1 Tax=Mesoplasma lactucae ATCC 49193 TaxID=81460 RepID=A0A291ISH4_9MOLU|nr:tRNA uridine-5-carboxymethylaminomethyl(34) synthesis GTPase MnmE [Mesoplasma lactucae]ATG97710.1 tRNA uridine-5-carboxymethylaminomethyl(34) synthesis GTPase MnmE [Mesoplasma lactucae ATCC 49193]ATZ20515.1 tRNA modification GTPase TrmE [Mesoplasma lactucae ATCC 49193]MCL8216686.1 tRNA modification GTPase MnmE [Mesoplasma lactucae ATCC 49193]
MAQINDTIVAPATNIATQAISLIRISGEDAREITNKMTKKPVPDKRGFYLRKLYEGSELVDEVVINFYNAPNSFTGEEVVEIACHGGILNTNHIINVILKNGARMALKGEFSQRAFLNGKIDLIQAEGINDLIHASNDLALKIGIDNMSGSHNKAVLILKEKLMDIISRIQVSIDYPDYDDVEGSSHEDLILLLQQIANDVDGIIKRSKMAVKSVDGINTAIIGETNVGKSSLLNALINEDKAIVTDVPGTTRDIVEGKINLGNTTINLIDTAGIRETTDVVENIGINKSKEYIKKADLVLYVVNYDNYKDKQNQAMYNLLKDKQHIIILNKSKDLTSEQIKEVNNYFGEKVVTTNALYGDIDNLINLIEDKYNNEEILKEDSLVLINLNQISLLEKVSSNVHKALDNIKADFPIDIVNVDLYEAWNYLGELIGEQYDEEIIDNIFRKYCLGK